MKSMRVLILSGILFSFAFSCSNDDDPKLMPEAISGTWTTSLDNREQIFVEFMPSGIYIVSEMTDFIFETTSSEGNPLFGRKLQHSIGKYRILNPTQVELSKYGTITIADMSENDMIFYLNKTGGSLIQLYKVDEMRKPAGNSYTNLLSTTPWAVHTAGNPNKSGVAVFLESGIYFFCSTDGKVNISPYWWTVNNE